MQVSWSHLSIFACQSTDRFLSVWAEAAAAVSSSWAQSHCDITPRCRTVSRLTWSCWMCTGVCNCCIRRQVISAHLRWWLFIKIGEGKTWCYLQYYSHTGRCSVLCFWDPLRAPAAVTLVLCAQWWKKVNNKCRIQEWSISGPKKWIRP